MHCIRVSLNKTELNWIELTNSPCQHLSKYTEDSMENKNTDVRVPGSFTFS